MARTIKLTAKMKCCSVARGSCARGSDQRRGIEQQPFCRRDTIVSKHEPDSAHNQRQVNSAHHQLTLLPRPSPLLAAVIFTCTLLWAKLSVAPGDTFHKSPPGSPDRWSNVDRWRAGSCEHRDSWHSWPPASSRTGLPVRGSFRKRFYPVRRQIVLGVHSLRGMAITANLAEIFNGELLFECHYFVLGMAIGAGRGIPVPGRNGFAMHALGDILGRLVVAATASLGQARKWSGVPASWAAGWCVRHGNRCRCRVLLAAGQCQPMHAGTVAF